MLGITEGRIVGFLVGILVGRLEGKVVGFVLGEVVGNIVFVQSILPQQNQIITYKRSLRILLRKIHYSDFN